MAKAARGLIAVDKMGGKVLFLNPVTYRRKSRSTAFPAPSTNYL